MYFKKVEIDLHINFILFFSCFLYLYHVAPSLFPYAHTCSRTHVRTLLLLKAAVFLHSGRRSAWWVETQATCSCKQDMNVGL